MKKSISNPKVFISYAWGDKDYQNEVLSFATKLRGEGIDAILDKWDLSEGNDTYAFMEKCVNDPSITNVLILLDPLYAKKANDHTGGVGTETQIISAKVYKEVEQDKFIPIIMKRNDKGEVCKPTYLEGRLHFDLSVPEDYDENYTRLVRKLYGVETYEKPKLGNKPDWVDNPISVSQKSKIAYDRISQSKDRGYKDRLFQSYLNEIIKRFINYANDSQNIIGTDNQIAIYDGSVNIRNDYLQLLSKSYALENSCQMVAEFFEDLKNSFPQYGGFPDEVIYIRIHELFIYTIAYYLNNKDYSSAGYILGKSYFERKMGKSIERNSFKIFYGGFEQRNLSNAVNKRDGKNYYSGTGQRWIDTLATDYCSKDQFVLADLICFNYSIYGNDYSDFDKWFPITYVYDNRFDSALAIIAKKLISKEQAIKIINLFGYESIESFVDKFKEVENGAPEIHNHYRYNMAFESARILGDFIKSDEIAQYS